MEIIKKASILPSVIHILFESIAKVYKFLKSNLKDSERIKRKRKQRVKKNYPENFLKTAILNSATKNLNKRLKNARSTN